MPLVDVTYDSSVSEEALRHLIDVLPDVVAEAVECEEEPWVGPPAVGDIEIRCRPKSKFDVGELNVTIEVRTKLFDSRLADKQRRADQIRGNLATVQLGMIGVWLILVDGAWSQS